jgi:TM2 domain-containing membrane protein YozV
VDVSYDQEPHDPYADTARLSPATPTSPWREPDPTKHDLEAYGPPPAAPPPAPMPPAPMPPAYNPPPPAYQQVQPYQQPYQHQQPYPPRSRPLKSTSAAVMLELFLGLFGLFGVGALYANRTGLGVTLMVSYWVLFWTNVALAFVVIGLVTGPITWLFYMILSPVLAARAVDQHNAY